MQQLSESSSRLWLNLFPLTHPGFPLDVIYKGNFSAKLYYKAFSKEAGACGRGSISGGVENYMQCEQTTMLAYILFFISHFRFSCSGIGKTSKPFLEEEEFEVLCGKLERGVCSFP